MYMIRFDMRAPAFGAATTDLYGAAIDMCGWAEQHGCLAVVLCEHHGAADGYLPSPMILGAAIAARTDRLALTPILILPFYDPVRLAEDMAVLDIISRGRTSYILALGYRPEEFEHFDVDIRTRGRAVDEKLDLLRGLLTGEVDFNGRHIDVTPRPHTAGGPMLMWGGGTVAAARRAGRYGLGMLGNANVAGMQEAYEAGVESTDTSPARCFCPTVTPHRCASSLKTLTRRGTNLAPTCCMTREAMRSGTRTMRRQQASRTCAPSKSCVQSPGPIASTAWPRPRRGYARERSSTCRRFVVACRRNWRGHT
ncbi:MAG: hypothetical protein QOF67_1416 [Mycobacterium sp.]|nr:hypothetical protein [Mycobacterium sp.]